MHQVKRRLLLDVEVNQRAGTLQLLSCHDEPLVVGRDARLHLDEQLRVADLGFRANVVQRDRLAC